ncbi:MAG: hypothetical protein AABY22_29305 [Nanoarchaeota archaeon]
MRITKKEVKTMFSLILLSLGIGLVEPSLENLISQTLHPALAGMIILIAGAFIFNYNK